MWTVANQTSESQSIDCRSFTAQWVWTICLETRSTWAKMVRVDKNHHTSKMQAMLHHHEVSSCSIHSFQHIDLQLSRQSSCPSCSCWSWACSNFMLPAWEVEPTSSGQRWRRSQSEQHWKGCLELVGPSTCSDLRHRRYRSEKCRQLSEHQTFGLLQQHVRA